jgi:hypothetical protein
MGLKGHRLWDMGHINSNVQSLAAALAVVEGFVEVPQQQRAAALALVLAVAHEGVERREVVLQHRRGRVALLGGPLQHGARLLRVAVP